VLGLSSGVIVRLPALYWQVQARLSGLKAPSAIHTLFGEAREAHGDGVAFSSMPFITTDHKGRQQVVMMQVPFTVPSPAALGPELTSAGVRDVAPSSLWALEDVGALQDRGSPHPAIATPGTADSKGTPLNRWRTRRQARALDTTPIGVGGRVGKDGGVDAAAADRAAGCCGAAAPESMLGRVERSWYL
jgi:hypothetical protein